MPNPRYKIHVSGPVSRAVVQWLYQLIPVLRRAPKNVVVTVEVKDDDPDD